MGTGPATTVAHPTRGRRIIHLPRGQHKPSREQPPAPASLHHTLAAAGINSDLQAEFAKLLGNFAATRGQAGAGLAELAASLAPAPVVPPTAKQRHEQASADLRQAIKAKQALENQHSHLKGRKVEIELQLSKVVADVAATEAKFEDATAKVQEMQAALDAADRAAQEAAKRPPGGEAPPHPGAGAAGGAGLPAADLPRFDAKTWAQDMAKNLAKDMEVEEQEPEEGGGGKQPREGDGGDGSSETGEPKKRPRLDSGRLARTLEEKFAASLQQQLAAQQAAFDQKTALQEKKLNEKLSEMQQSAATFAAQLGIGTGGVFRTCGRCHHCGLSPRWGT